MKKYFIFLSVFLGFLLITFIAGNSQTLQTQKSQKSNININRMQIEMKKMQIQMNKMKSELELLKDEIKKYKRYIIVGRSTIILKGAVKMLHGNQLTAYFGGRGNISLGTSIGIHNGIVSFRDFVEFRKSASFNVHVSFKDHVSFYKKPYHHY